MKRNLTLALATLMALLVFQTSSLRLQSHIEAPPAGGLAGDPHQTNCGACHSTQVAYTTRNSQFIIQIAPDSAGLSSSANVSISSTATYTPNHPNWISLELTGVNTNSPGDTGWYGFQFTALKSNDSMAGNFTLLDPFTSMQTNAFTQIGGRTPVPAADTIYYVGHNNPNFVHFIQKWYFIWNAPDSSAGPVTFYYAGNMGNGNRQADISLSNTDSIFVGSVTLTPGAASTVGISNVAHDIEAVSVFPTPFSDQLNANLYLGNPSNVSITLLSIDGQVVRDLYYGAAAQGHFSRSFDLGGISAGMYFVKVQSGTDSKVVKVLKY